MRNQDQEGADDDPRSNTPSFQELRTLRAVVTLRTTAAAARSLAVSQPAVSRSLASLENRLGRSLFTRSSGLLVPTPEAVALSGEANSILLALDRLVSGAIPNPGDPVLHLITTATLAQGYLARLLPELMRVHPDLRMQVEISTASAVLTAVADGTADAGLLDQFTPHGSLTAEILHRSQAHVVMPQDHHLAGHEKIGVPLLAGVPIIALPRRFSLRAQIDRAFHDAGLQPRTIMECATTLFAAEMVRSGVGVSILNRFPLQDICPDLVFRKFVPEIAIETAVVVPSAMHPGPSVRQFVEFLKQVQEKDGTDAPA